MTDEILGTRLKTERFINRLHAILVQVDTYKSPVLAARSTSTRMLKQTLVCGRVFILPALQELKELLRPAFLEQAHQRALHGLHLGTRDLRDLAIAIHEATGDLFELEVASNIGVDENLGELPRCDNELGNKIDGVVPVAPQLGWWSLTTELLVELYAS